MKKALSPSLIAFKALSLCDDLIATRRRVLAALIEHFNRQNGRCDPSVDRLAALLGINRRTVFRALKSLVVKGYIVRYRHGGLQHRNQYVPNWPFFIAIVEKWDEQFRAASRARLATDVSPSRRQSGHLAGGPSVTQTFSDNHAKQTLESIRKKNASEVRNGTTGGHSAGQPARRLLSPTSRDASQDAAERRWNRDLQLFLKGDERLTAVTVDMMTPELMRAATDAEFVARGAGLPVVLAALRRVQGEGGPQ